VQAAEFGKILDHPGVVSISLPHALAYARVARAHALAGDPEKAGKSYEHFFELWKDADPDVPVLKATQAEYTALLRQRTLN
jgi:hypothetical protein